MNRMFLKRLGPRIQRDFRQILNGLLLNAQEVRLHVDVSMPRANYNPNVASTYPAPVLVVRTLRALVHIVADTTHFHGYEGFERGDMLLFLQPGEDLSGAAPWFEINGLAYVQKENGTLLGQDWSGEIGGRIINRALLLRRKPGDKKDAGPVCGFVDYVDAGGTRTPFYAFGEHCGYLASPGLRPALAEIAAGAAVLEFRIAGVPVLRAVAGSLLIRGLVNAPLADGSPMLEFRLNSGRVVGQLSAAGILSAPGDTQGTTDPADARDFDFRAGAEWVASLGATGLRAYSYSTDW